MHLTHKDVWLSYFENRQNQIHKLMGGDPLIITADGCNDKQGVSILKFSQKFRDELMARQKEGYKIIEANVNHIVYWQDEDEDKEIEIVLPELYLER